MRYFITEQDLKNNTTIQPNVDISLLSPFIALAQDKHIKPVLSEKLHDALSKYIQGFPESITTFPATFPIRLVPAGIGYFENTKAFDDLLAQLKQAHIFWTAVEALPFIQVKITNKGLLNKAGGESIDHAAYKSLENSFRSTANHYTEELIKFLEKNAIDYPDYKAPKSDSTTRLIAGICFN